MEKSDLSGSTFRAGENLQAPIWDDTNLVAIKKKFYAPHPDTENRSEEDVKSYRKSNRINISADVPKPILRFEELQVDDLIMEEINNKKFKQVTPIQAQGLPIALSGTNMVGIGQTG